MTIYLHRLGDVLRVMLGVLICYVGISGFVDIFCGVIVTGRPIYGLAVIASSIFLVIGVLIIRPFRKRKNKWDYSLGIALLVISILPISSSREVSGSIENREGIDNVMSNNPAMVPDTWTKIQQNQTLEQYAMMELYVITMLIIGVTLFIFGAISIGRTIRKQK